MTKANLLTNWHVERSLPDDGEPAAGQTRRRSVTVNIAESPLTWLHARGLLNDRQYDAGEKLRSDYEGAQLAPSVTMRWSPTPLAQGRRAASCHLEPAERQLVAKRRFDDAIAALGCDLSAIAWRVICAGEGVPGAERAMGWPARSGKLVLRIALDRLADHYRLA